MAVSIKRLRSAIHSLGHHSMSGVCYVHTHLAESCKALGTNAGSINLLDGAVLSPSVEISKSLRLGAQALAEKFKQILLSEAIDFNALESARVDFQFNLGRWPSSCYVRAKIIDGREIKVAIDGEGRKAVLLNAST